MAYIPSSGSVVAFQSNPSVLQALVTVTNPVNVSSISGAVTFPPGSIVSVTNPAGSIAAVSATIVGTPNVNTAGSVVAFQGTTPWLTNQGGSVITVSKDSSIISLQLAGSVLATSATFTPAANQSVSGAITFPPASIASVTNPAGSVTAVLATQVTSPWIVAPNNSSLFALQVAGSVLAISGTLNAPANQSVSGAVSVSNFPALQDISGSVVAFQGTANWTVKSSLAGGIFPVSGSVAATIVGTPTVNAPAGSVMTVATLAGSIMAVSATQVTSPWIVAPNNSSLFSLQPAGSIMATSATLLPGSVSGAITAPPGSIMAVAGATTTTAGSIISATFPAGSIAQISGATTTTAGSIISATFPAGSVAAVRTDSASVITTQLAGSIMATSATLTTGSVMLLNSTTVIGSVATLQGTNPWTVVTPAGSIQSTTNPAGSVTAVIWQAASIVGTYAEDAASATADKGVFVLGVRNDTLSSVTSADGDYGAATLDAVGRVITKPFAGENATIISYVGSIVSGSVQLIQASVIGSRSYITDFWLSNTGAAATLVTFQGGDTSIVGQFIAPTTGGMSSPGLAIPLKTNLSQDLAFKVSPSSSVLYVTLKGYQAP